MKNPLAIYASAALVSLLFSGCGTTEISAPVKAPVKKTQVKTAQAKTSHVTKNLAAKPKPAPSPPQPKWHTVMTVKGNGMKNTKTFHIRSDEWLIDWNTTANESGPGNFIVWIYKADGSPAGIAANVIGADRDQTVMHGAGDYYFEITAGQPFTIKVSDYY